MGANFFNYFLNLNFEFNEVRHIYFCFFMGNLNFCWIKMILDKIHNNNIVISLFVIVINII